MSQDIPNVLPYPLPPWEHDFQVLAVFGNVEEGKLQSLIPAPLKLCSNVVQISVMYFNSSVPTEPYYDAAVIADVEYGGVRGGYWVYGFTSTDLVAAGTREIWGYKMKRGDHWALGGGSDHYHGYISRRGKKVINIDMAVNGKDFTPPSLFPRLFLKVIPHANEAQANINKVVLMRAETTAVTLDVKGDAVLSMEPSEQDPLAELGPVDLIGANYIEGHQILPWAEEMP
ncbi:MAG: acetoacetate decarboxylase family protein [Pseudomonadota bacterium]